MEIVVEYFLKKPFLCTCRVLGDGGAGESVEEAPPPTPPDDDELARGRLRCTSPEVWKKS